MFADGCEKASHFTHPLIVSVRRFDGTVTCSLGAFVVLNPEGWAITVAHLLEVAPIHQKHSIEIAEYEKHIAAIESDEHLNAKQKRKKKRRLRSNPEWIVNHSLLVGVGWCRLHGIESLSRRRFRSSKTRAI